jgi:hypothetical protein
MDTRVEEIEFFGRQAKHGRDILSKYLLEELVESKKKLTIPSIIKIWNICRKGKEFSIGSTFYKPRGPLGFRIGTKVWMESIVVRHYANNINALVYGGAMVLLIFVGLRFAKAIDERTALIGIAIEACMLFLLAFLMFYTPEENGQEEINEPVKNLQNTIKDLSLVVGRMRGTLDPTQENKIREIVRAELFELIGKGIERTYTKLETETANSSTPSK